jgi:CRP/FNR family cyclic AMP-dependent transcriptional regulator
LCIAGRRLALRTTSGPETLGDRSRRIEFTAETEFPEAVLADVRKEMAMPPKAEFPQHAISQNRRPNPLMRSRLKTPPHISFDLDGLVALNRSFATGGTIFSEGDIAETLLYIQTGRVKLSVASKAHKEAIVAILGPGEFLGETCLGSQRKRMRTATAIAPTALQVIKRNEMIRALHTDHALSYRFVSYLISRNIRLEEDLVDQVSHGSERRLARTLLLLAGNDDRRKLHSFAGISQGTLAALIGTTRSRVNLFMNKFKMLGFVKYRGALDAHGGIHINTARLARVLRK